MLRLLTLLILLAASTATAQDGPIPIKNKLQNERAYLNDARLLSKTHLPSPKELGPGWSWPWESKAPGAPRSMIDFWVSINQKFGFTPIWASFHGSNEKEALQQLRETLPEIRAEMEQTPDLAPAGITTYEELLRMLIAMIRTVNAAALESEPLYAVNNAEIADGMASIGGNPAAPGGGEVFRMVVETMTPELAGATEDELARALARDATLVRKFTTMEYYHIAEGSSLIEDEIPLYAKFSVEVYVMRRDAIGREIVDLDAKDLPQFKSAYEARLAELARNMPMARAKYTVKVEPREIGDNAWIVVTHARTVVPGLESITDVHGRVRNGNAIINVKGEGTYPGPWLEQQLDYILKAVESRTSQYAEDI